RTWRAARTTIGRLRRQGSALVRHRPLVRGSGSDPRPHALARKRAAAETGTAAAGAVVDFAGEAERAHEDALNALKMTVRVRIRPLVRSMHHIRTWRKPCENFFQCSLVWRS